MIDPTIAPIFTFCAGWTLRAFVDRKWEEALWSAVVTISALVVWGVK